MYVDIVISNAFNLNYYIFFPVFYLTSLNDSILRHLWYSLSKLVTQTNLLISIVEAKSMLVLVELRHTFYCRQPVPKMCLLYFQSVRIVTKCVIYIFKWFLRNKYNRGFAVIVLFKLYSMYLLTRRDE